MVQQNPNVRTAFDFFMGRGYSQAQTAGIIGNLYGESALQTGAVGDGGKAKGIAQWHPDRWSPLQSWAHAQGKDPMDFTTQLEMVDHELRTKEVRAFNSLMKAKTVDEATAAFIGFERPKGFTWNSPRSGHNYSGRLQSANSAFGLITGVTPPSVSTLGLSGETSNYRVGDHGNSVNSLEASQGVIPNTNAELRQIEERQDDEPDVSLWQGVKDAINTDWSLAQFWQDRPEWAPDQNFRLDQSTMETLTSGIPERYWDRFADAQSMAHAQGMRENLEKSLEAEQRLASLGWTGVGLRVAAGLTDPLAWAAAAGVSVASLGAGAPAAVAARFGKAGMIGLTAAEAGAGTAITEGILAANRPTYEASDFYWSVGMGMGLGGAFGVLRKNPHTIEEADRMVQVGRDLQKGAMPTGGSTAGAQQITPAQPLRMDTSDIVRDGVAPSVMRGPRYDSAHAMKTSDNTLTAMIGNHLVEDAARNVDGVTPIGASEVQQWIEITSHARWAASGDANFRQFRTRNPKATRADFDNQVSHFVRDQDVLVDYDPAVKAQGAEMREILGEFAEMAANPGVIDGRNLRAVRGFEGRTRNDYYVPRMFDLGAITNAIRSFGQDTLVGLLARGAKQVNGEIDEEVARKFFKGYVSRLHSLSAGDLQANYRAFSGEDLDGLKQNLMNFSDDLLEDDIDTMIAHMRPQNGDGASRHGKQRALYQENYGEVLPFSDGRTGGQFFRISDLFINDSDKLMRSYMRTISGRIAMARMEIKNPRWQPGDAADEFFVQGITSDGEWDTLMRRVVSVGDEMGIKAGRTQEDLERMNWAYNTIVGRSMNNEGSWTNQALRMGRDYNFLRVMGQVGWAQVSETMNIVGHLGLKAAFSNMPMYRFIMRNARTGRLDDDLAREIEEVLGTGTDWVRHQTHRRMDVFENPMDTFDNPWVQKFDDFLQQGKRVVSAASGMAPINTVLQRWAGRAIYNKFAMNALGRTKMNPRRLQALGLDADMVERINTSIRNHARFEGKNLRSMGMDQWPDREAAAAFQLGAFRLSRAIVQENDIGGMTMWMSRPLARTFLQFRSFMLQAYTKQFLQGINFHDTGTAVSFVGSAVAASLVYVARTHMNALGRSDRDEYLDRRLTPGRLVAAGIQNSTWASIMPPLTDLVASPFMPEGEAIFDARNTQLSGSILWGNPTADLGDSLIRAVGNVGELVRGKPLSQSDMRAFARILPFQNLNGLAQLYSGMISSLPEWSPRR